MKKPLVSIIIVNWNGGEVFGECLESLSKLTYPNWEVIVVDNGSTDGSEKYQVSGIKHQVIKNKKNVGFATANNQGYEVSKGKYLLLLNNDTKVSPSLLDVLVEKMESDGGVGVLQPKIYLMDKKGYLDNCGSFITRVGLLQHRGFMRKDSKEFGKESEVFSGKGACLLLRREVIEKVGLFDEDFVSYFEESDFCWRVWLSGSRVIFYPKTYLYHKMGFTSRRLEPILVNYHSTKNRILSLFKNLDRKNILSVLLPHLIIIKGLFFYYLLKGEHHKARMVFDALWWNLANIKNSINKRKKVQKLRVVSDDYIFNKVGKDVDVSEMTRHFRKIEANF